MKYQEKEGVLVFSLAYKKTANYCFLRSALPGCPHNEKLQMFGAVSCELGKLIDMT